MDYKFTFKKAVKFFKTICQHKWIVFKWCCKFGFIWRGIMHDMSKFSPVEFIESVKYYTGDVSPITKCKEVNGISRAWLHHKRVNLHHYEAWTDKYDTGTICHLMPFKYAVEQLADYIAAGTVYNKGRFDIDSEIVWWENKKKTCIMHKANQRFLDDCFTCIKENKRLTRKFLKYLYEMSVCLYDLDRDMENEAANLQ